MKKINRGTIKDNVFTKHVSFSKAVFWKDRMLSLPPATVEKLRQEGVQKLRFIDGFKKEVWEFNAEHVWEQATLKQVGQEPQYYFSIDIAKKKTL